MPPGKGGGALQPRPLIVSGALRVAGAPGVVIGHNPKIAPKPDTGTRVVAVPERLKPVQDSGSPGRDSAVRDGRAIRLPRDPFRPAWGPYAPTGWFPHPPRARQGRGM